MDGFESSTWQALGLVLTAVGLAVSALVWTRRGALSGLRGVAWSLLPLAAGLTGVLELGWEITESVVDWAAGLAFSPVVWLGLVVAAVSMVLFVVTGMVRRRGGGAAPKATVAGDRPAELPRRRSAPAAKSPTGASKTGTSTTGSGDDMDEIEEILRRHGIQ